MACLTCGSFDPNYHGGYCNYHSCDTSPDGTCRKEDSRGGGYSDDICSTCRFFDANYHGGYCDYHGCDTYPSSSCGNHS